MKDNMVDLLSMSCGEVVDVHDFNDWLERGLSKDGPWSRFTEESQKIHHYLTHELLHLGRDADDIRLGLNRANNGCPSNYINYVRDHVCGLFKEKISNGV